MPPANPDLSGLRTPLQAFPDVLADFVCKAPLDTPVSKEVNGANRNLIPVFVKPCHAE